MGRHAGIIWIVGFSLICLSNTDPTRYQNSRYRQLVAPADLDNSNPRHPATPGGYIYIFFCVYFISQYLIKYISSSAYLTTVFRYTNCIVQYYYYYFLLTIDLSII